MYIFNGSANTLITSNTQIEWNLTMYAHTLTVRHLRWNTYYKRWFNTTELHLASVGCPWGTQSKARPQSSKAAHDKSYPALTKWHPIPIFLPVPHLAQPNSNAIASCFAVYTSFLNIWYKKYVTQWLSHTKLQPVRGRLKVQKEHT